MTCDTNFHHDLRRRLVAAGSPLAAESESARCLGPKDCAVAADPLSWLVGGEREVMEGLAAAVVELCWVAVVTGRAQLEGGWQ